MKIFAANLQTMVTGGDDVPPSESASNSVNGVSLVAGALCSMFRRGDKNEKDEKEVSSA